MPCGRPVHWERATVSVMEPQVTATRCSRYFAEQATLFGSHAHGLLPCTPSINSKGCDDNTDAGAIRYGRAIRDLPSISGIA